MGGGSIHRIGIIALFALMAGCPPTSDRGGNDGSDGTDGADGTDGTTDGIDPPGPVCLNPEVTLPYTADGAVIWLPLRDQPTIESIPWAQFSMRPVDIDALGAGSITINVTGSVSVWHDGVELTEPLTLTEDEVPIQLLVGGIGVGEATLTITPDEDEDPCEAISVAMQVGVDPGLTGRSLTGSPWFEFIDTFNIDEQVEVSLDPVRYADRVGLEYDLYVVEHRTVDEWAADQTLIQVPTSLESGTVSSGTTEDGLVTAWASDLIVPTDAIDAYDVVVDFGRDGKLDPGDVIDGLGPRAGAWVVGDLTAPGPYTTESFDHSGSAWLTQRVFLPSNIASLSDVPLVVISHGNGHEYTWYDYLGHHLASYGFVVMTHRNNTGPGVVQAAETTRSNTEYLLDELPNLQGGVMAGVLDEQRIGWVGHSRGGEGVVIAYDRIKRGQWSATNYGIGQIKVVSSIAPTVFEGITSGGANPHSVTYHLMVGGSDGDVTQDPGCDLCQSYRIAGAAQGRVQTTYLQGAAHNDFHDGGGWDDGRGPDRIGKTATNNVAKAYYLALMSWHLKGEVAFADYFMRIKEGFRPNGLPLEAIVSGTWRAAVADNVGAIDTFQQGASAEESSSGGTVSFSVDNLMEGRLDDNNARLEWKDGDPFNGTTWVHADGFERGVAFDWATEAGYTQTVTEEMSDFTPWSLLTFKVAQGTRHPNTVSLGGPLHFTVALVDGAGTQAPIDFGMYGRVLPPYPRTGKGDGEGWVNEFETVRIHLAEFQAVAPDLDLTDVDSVQFRFGGTNGSATGRVILDDIVLANLPGSTREVAP